MINDNEKLDLLLASYNDPELTESQRAKIENRVRTDPEAQKRLSEYQRLDNLLSGLPSLTNNVDFDHFSGNISRAIRTTTIKQNRFALSWENVRFRRLAIPAAAAAVMAMALVIWATLINPSSPQSESAAKTSFVRVMPPQAPVQIAGTGNYVRLFNSRSKESQSVEKIVTPVQVCLNQGSGSPAGNFTYGEGEVIYFTTPPSSRPIETVEENFSAYF
jgi:hypothetical protein